MTSPPPLLTTVGKGSSCKFFRRVASMIGSTGASSSATPMSGLCDGLGLLGPPRGGKRPRRPEGLLSSLGDMTPGGGGAGPSDLLTCGWAGGSFIMASADSSGMLWCSLLDCCVSEEVEMVRSRLGGGAVLREEFSRLTPGGIVGWGGPAIVPSLRKPPGGGAIMVPSRRIIIPGGGGPAMVPSRRIIPGGGGRMIVPSLWSTLGGGGPLKNIVGGGPPMVPSLCSIIPGGGGLTPPAGILGLIIVPSLPIIPGGGIGPDAIPGAGCCVRVFWRRIMLIARSSPGGSGLAPGGVLPGPSLPGGPSCSAPC